jgi:hypothetical protein
MPQGARTRGHPPTTTLVSSSNVLCKATLQDSLQRKSEKQTLNAIGLFQRKMQ